MFILYSLGPVVSRAVGSSSYTSSSSSPTLNLYSVDLNPPIIASSTHQLQLQRYFNECCIRCSFVNKELRGKGAAKIPILTYFAQCSDA